MAVFKNVTEIFDDLKTSITSALPAFIFSLGSVIHTVTQAFALAMEDIHIEAEDVLSDVHISTASLAGLILIGDDYGIPQNLATKSKRMIRFERNVAATQDYVIPNGKRVGTVLDVFGTRKNFLVIDTATLLTGSSYVDVLCEAEVAGTAYNVPAGSSVELVDGVTGIDKVSIITSASNQEALDDEEADDYRDRIRKKFLNSSQGTLEAIEAAALSVPGVKTVIVTENNTNDGIVNVFASDGVGLPGSLAASILTACNDVKAGGGITINVQALTSIDVICVMNVTINAGFNSTEKQAIKDSIVAAINAYVDSLERGVDSLVYKKIEGAVVNSLSVKDINSLTVNGGTANVSASATKFFKVVTLPSITFTEV